MMIIAAALLSTQVSLAGLWEAKRWYGPDARGTIVVRREGTAWNADFIGRTIPVRNDSGVLTFAIPEGSFRGHFEKEQLLGLWTQPPKTSDGNVYATPVHFQPDGAQRWRGEVAPADETFTFYLMIGPNGEAFLRNPERNTAIFWRVSRLARDGRTVKLYRENDEVLAEGTYDEDSDTMALAFPGRGGTYDFRRGSDHSAFYPRGRKPEAYTYHAPLARNDGWPVATLEDVHIDRAKIEKFMQMLLDLPMDSLHAPDIHAVLIARHGKLVLEEYFHGMSRDTLHETRSATKSLATILFGAAGLDPSIPVYATLGAEADDPRKRTMTAANLMTMASGFYCDDSDEKAPGRENYMNEQTEEPNYYRFALRLPMAYNPGEKSIYCSTNANLVGAVIAKAARAPLTDLFERLVARPMQFGRYAFGLQPTGEPYFGGGWLIQPRDFLKLGQLITGDGMWRGKRILSHDFVTRASSPLYQLGRRKYGYLFWVDERAYNDRTVREVLVLGNGGQIVMAVPELDLVVVFMGGNYSDNPLLLSRTNVYVPESILPAVE